MRISRGSSEMPSVPSSEWVIGPVQPRRTSVVLARFLRYLAGEDILAGRLRLRRTMVWRKEGGIRYDASNLRSNHLATPKLL